jgi:hypothetical protein
MKANHNKIPPVICSVNTSTTYIDILGTTYVNYIPSLSLSLSLHIYIYTQTHIHMYRYKCIYICSKDCKMKNASEWHVFSIVSSLYELRVKTT